VIVIRVDERLAGVHELRGRRFDVLVDLPLREVRVKVTAVARRGSSSVTVRRVFGLPRAARPHWVNAAEDPVLARTVRRLARSYGRTCAIYVQDLRTGEGAAWNARARFPAASTLKLAIAIEALRSWTYVSQRHRALLWRMIVDSDNAAANDVEVAFGGSTYGGSTRVNALMRSIGLHETEMYGGYERTTQSRRHPIPARVDDQGWGGGGKYTTAGDLARLATYVHLAAERKGPLARRGFTGADARYLLWLLAHVADSGKLDRFLRNARVLHKGGWIAPARHDSGLVYWPGGALVVTVMTYRSWGVGGSSDVLAGRVAAAALARARTKVR